VNIEGEIPMSNKGYRCAFGLAALTVLALSCAGAQAAPQSSAIPIPPGSKATVQGQTALITNTGNGEVTGSYTCACIGTQGGGRCEFIVSQSTIVCGNPDPPTADRCLGTCFMSAKVGAPARTSAHQGTTNANPHP
jgi:hypothetical protein